MTTTAHAVLTPQGGSNPAEEQTAVVGSGRLTAFSVYTGVINSVNMATRLCTVMVNKTILTDCVFVPGALAAFMGFTNTALPPVGATVLVVYMPHTSFIIGTQPTSLDSYVAYTGAVAGSYNTDLVAKQEAYNVKGPTESDDKNISAPGYTMPRDMYPGEYSIENNMGIALRLLHNFEQMTAGDLAKIEVHLLNDMVRIVDNYFVHHNVGGDTLIWSNGRCNYESHFTGYPHEAEGKETEKDKYAEEAAENVTDPDKSCRPFGDVNATGRWRKSTYVGFLADMIHTWVTDPTDMLSTYAKHADRAGKYRSWVGSDGTVMVQTVAGVQIEVTPRIVVPTMLDKWDNPNKDVADAIKDLDKKFLKMWGKGPDWKDLSVACWQMRNYAKYISLYHSLARFKQYENKKRCSIRTEAQTPKPEPTCKEEDKEDVNSEGKEPYNNHAIFSMDPSGSISVIANGTTSVVLNRGNVQISAPGNIELQCGGVLSLSAKDVSIKAARHIEIAAIAGSLWLKARSAWNALCEKGRMWLKSNMDDSDDVSAEPFPAKGDPDADSVVVDKGNFAIVLDASQGRVCTHGNKGVVVGTTGQEAPINIQTNTKDSEIALWSGATLNMVSNAETFMYNTRFGMDSNSVMLDSPVVQLGGSVLFEMGMTEISGRVRASSFYSLGGYVGPSDTVSIYQKEEDATPQPYNAGAVHDGIKARSQLQNKDILTWDIQKAELELFDWAFYEWEPPSSFIEDWTSLKAPILHDTIETSKTSIKDQFYKVDWGSCALLKAPHTDNKSYPWPGRWGEIFKFSKKNTPALGEIWDKQFDRDMIATMADMELDTYTFYTRDRDKNEDDKPKA